MKKLLLISSLCCLSLTVFGQTGILRGTIRDGKTHDAIIGATVQIMGLPTPMGISTDVNGQFELAKVPAGSHTIQISYVSYKTKSVPNVRIESGNATVLETDLSEDNQQLQEVVVKAGRTTNTEIAVVAEIKQIKAMAVGVSAQQIQKAQDRDAAAAIRRVPGVSIVDNRFVLIRGLGSRYNSVMINDVITPSTEVDTRSFSFDIVPTNVIDRIIIYKSGLAELPGDFAGGVIKIYTKRRPEQNFTDVGVTVGYRDNTTFRNAQSQTRSGLSAFGLWSREDQLPSSFPTSGFNNLSPLQRAAYGKLLPNNWGLNNITVAPDVRVALNTGRQFTWGNVRVSNLTNINFSSTNQSAGVDLRLYQNGAEANDVFEQYNDANYARQTRLGVLHNWSFRLTPAFNLEWKTLYNLLSSTETVARSGQRVIDGIETQAYSQRFENRNILTSQLAGEHTISDLTKLNWIAGFGYTGRWEPDWRRVRYQRTIGSTGPDGQPAPFQIAAPFTANPIDLGRFYSKLNEFTQTVAVNGEHTFGTPTDREPNKLRFGIYGENRNRDYSSRFYGYIPIGNTGTILQQPLESAFSPSNITGQQGGLTLSDGTRDIDAYRGKTMYGAGYVSGDVYLGQRTNLTLGFRGEYYVQQLNATIAGVDRQLVNNPVFSPLPSVNFNYKLSETQSLRLAYSATVNRPELRELAPYSYFDFNLIADIRGNTTLKTATIQNADLKWEMYPSQGELISVSAFYKHFTNPIESFLIPQSNGLAYTFTNAQSARNYGVEVEVRKGFPNASSQFLKNLQVVGNASLIQSQVDLGETVTAPDLSGAIQQYPTRDLVDVKRPLANQSPYLINLGLYYAAPQGLQANLLYNVFGPRIFAVGTRENPTVYEMPRNVVDLNVSKTFNRQLELRFGIQDILNQPVRLAQDFNGDGKIGSDVTSKSANADQNVRQFRRGSYYTLSAVYTFGRRTVVP